MPLTTADLQWFQSGLPGSTGGVITTTAIPAAVATDLFPQVPRAALQTGRVDYVKVFITNANAGGLELNAAGVFVLFQPTANEVIGVALGSATDTDGSALTYVAPDVKENALSMGTLAAGASQAVWIRRQVKPGQNEFVASTFQLAVVGYDDNNLRVPSVLAFFWDLQPAAVPGEDMPLSLNYNFVLQRVDPDNGIRNQLDAEACVTIPDDIFGDSTYAFNDGDVDKSVPLCDDVIDILAIRTDQPITVKLNDVLGTPIQVLKTLFIDGQNITAVYISNSSGFAAHPRVIQAVRQPGHSQ